MNANGPIVIIDDDPEEVLILKELIQEISPRHRVVVISQSSDAIEYLSTCEKPFLILSGVNLRGLNGFQLRNLILEDKVLARKCAPFIFYSAHSTEEMLSKVYDLQASGYLHDVNDYNELGKRLSLMINYWEQCAV